MRKVNINKIDLFVYFIKLFPEFFKGMNDKIQIFDKTGVIDSLYINDLIDFDSG